MELASFMSCSKGKDVDLEGTGIIAWSAELEWLKYYRPVHKFSVVGFWAAILHTVLVDTHTRHVEVYCLSQQIRP
jgi:hypothetical protein